MNCDQAFDAMTDPDRPHDRELGDHLRACPRCRQMYETLEPALGLFAAVEDEPVETASSAPMQLAQSPARVAHQIAGRMSAAASGSHGEVPRGRMWGAILAAAVAGFLLSVGLSSFSPQLRPSPAGATAACTWLNRDAIPQQESASIVVVGCVTCHLSQSPHHDQQQSSIRDFSRELDSIVNTWNLTRLPSASMIAMRIPSSPLSDCDARRNTAA